MPPWAGSAREINVYLNFFREEFLTLHFCFQKKISKTNTFPHQTFTSFRGFDSSFCFLKNNQGAGRLAKSVRLRSKSLLLSGGKHFRFVSFAFKQNRRTNRCSFLCFVFCLLVWMRGTKFFSLWYLDKKR